MSQKPQKFRLAYTNTCQFTHLSIEEYKAAMGVDAKGADTLIPCPRCGTLCGGVELLVSIIPEGVGGERHAPDVLEQTLIDTLPVSPF